MVAAASMEVRHALRAQQHVLRAAVSRLEAAEDALRDNHRALGRGHLMMAGAYLHDLSDETSKAIRNLKRALRDMDETDEVP